TCITCGRGGQVVVCCETGCPMAFHQKCMTNEPKFDGMGRFYCRYCWYKRRVKRTKELRNMAMLSKKALSDFIDLTKVGGEKEKPGDGKVEGKEPDISEVVRDRKHSDFYKFQMDPSPFVVHGGDNVHRGQEDMSTRIESLHGSRSEEMFEVDVSKTHEYGVKEDGEMIQTEDLRQIDNGLREEIVEDHGYESLEEEETRDVSHHASMKGIQHTLVIYDTEQERMEEGKDEQKHLKSPDAATSSTGGDTALEEQGKKRKKIEEVQIQNADLPNKSPTQRKKAGRQILDSPQTSSSLPNRKKKFTMSKKSRQPQISPKTFLNVTFANGKRKRLHWTAEEEEMLKEGVQKFSTAVNKNIPWRKILEFGRHVFDVTRTPIDLKDKWRNIVAKDSRN
ncbi:Myb_DNA-binding domain-containing protein, partial [Cephalotus follicularis]